LSESRLHVQAFLEVAEIEYSLHRIDGAHELDLEELLSRVAPNVVPLGRPPPRSVLAELNEAAPRWPTWRAWQVTSLVAACASIAALALFILQPRGPQFTTAIGEQRTVELADTSVITLNALSKIEVHLEETERDIDLRQGEALFKVAHDSTRPFKVHTRAGTVQAVGTQFNVYDRPDGDTRVSVLEGRVKLTPRANAGTSEGGSQLLEAGEEADIRLDGTIRRKADAVVANTVAWRQRRLVFDNAALQEMVVEFNRYNSSLRLRLEGMPAEGYRYTGIFDAADPDSFVSLLSRESDLIIERRGDEVIVRPRIVTAH
jgi:transmembrane sensor